MTVLLSRAMAKPPKPPEPIIIDDLRILPERPPLQPGGAWWWRGWVYDPATKKSTPHTFGRGTRDEIRTKAKGWKPPAKVDPAPDIRTVRDLLRAFKAWQRTRMESGQIERNSFEAYSNSGRRLAKAEVAGNIGDLLLTTLEDADLEDFLTARLQAGHGARTANEDVHYLLAAWRYGRKRGWTPDRNLSPTMLEAKPVREKYTPPLGDVLKAAEHLPPARRLMVRIQLATGARPGEVAALDVADVDFEGEIIHFGLHEGARKTGERPVEAPSALFDELRAWLTRPPEPMRRGLRPADPSNARYLLGIRPVSSLSRLEKELPGACAKAGVKVFRPHAIRSVLEDDLAEIGIDPKVYASALGHTEAMALEVYRRASASARRKALSRSRAVIAMYGEPEGKVVSIGDGRKR